MSEEKHRNGNVLAEHRCIDFTDVKDSLTTHSRYD
jgi:hypothetical protein